MNKKIKKRIMITVIILLVATFLLYLPMICSFHRFAVTSGDLDGTLTYKGQKYQPDKHHWANPPKKLLGKELAVVISKSDRHNPEAYITVPFNFLAVQGNIYQSKMHKEEIVLVYYPGMDVYYIVYKK